MVDMLSHAPVSDAVGRTIRTILRKRLAPYGFTRATVEAGEDHDGDPVLFIDADYKLSKNPFDPAESGAALDEVRRALITLGEHRFPHIRHHPAKGQRILGVR